MRATLLRDGLGWGSLLWLIGYVLGIVMFVVAPVELIGWIILPIGVLLTLWVLQKKVQTDSLVHYFLLAVIWTAIAILFDYIFLVQLLKPADGYYKPDVYIYYLLTFTLPPLVGWWKSRAPN